MIDRSNGVNRDEFECFVPGRLCLMGEHSDWSGAMVQYNSEIPAGKTLVIGIPYGLYAFIRRIDEPLLKMTCTTDSGDQFYNEFPLDDEDALAIEAQSGSFWSYVAGTAYHFVTQFHVGGLEINNYKTTLPLKKGLSSSAAVCVLIARSFNRAFDLRLSTRGEMSFAYEGERLTPSQCGRMDQACAYGSTPVLMTYTGEVLKIQPAKLGATIYIVLVDLRASKDTVTILSSLQRAYPHPQTKEEHDLVDLLGKINQDLTSRATQALEEGNAKRLGELMKEAQAQFDEKASPLCPSQLGREGSPRLHQVLEYPAIAELIYGGKGVGSQGDGSAQLVCKDGKSQDEVCDILTNDLGVHCLKMELQPMNR